MAEEESFFNPPRRHFCGAVIIVSWDKHSNPRPDPDWKGTPVPWCPTCKSNAVFPVNLDNN